MKNPELPSVTIHKASRVFVPGGVATVTYNPRLTTMNVQIVETYIDRSGEILVVDGATKMGKTALVDSVVPNDRRIWLEGSWLQSIDDFWQRLGASLKIPKSSTGSTGTVKVAKWDFLAKLGFAGTGIQGRFGGEESASFTNGWTEELPLDQAVTQGLLLLAAQDTPWTIVIDDFHFAPPNVRTQVIQALKPLVRVRVPAILITLPHRRRDVSDGVSDIGGRVKTLTIKNWEPSELEVIADKGLAALGLFDLDRSIIRRLSQESYGSPQIMQALCLAICDLAVPPINATQDPPVPLQAPTDWAEFFKSIKDEQAVGWLERLAGGAKPRGNKRALFKLQDGRSLNGYELLLAAMYTLGPRLAMSEESIKTAASALLVPGTKPDADATKKLGRMSILAASSLNQAIPAEEDLDAITPDLQPVFEHAASDVPPTVYIVEPFLAYSLKWHGPYYLKGV